MVPTMDKLYGVPLWLNLSSQRALRIAIFLIEEGTWCEFPVLKNDLTLPSDHVLIL